MHLSPSELEQFFRIQSALNNFIYAQLQQAAGREAKLPFRELPFDKQMEVREAFATNPEFVERFVAENPSGLSPADLEVVLGWRKPVVGDFYLFKHLKKHSIFLSCDDEPIAFGVCGLTNSLADAIPAAQLPVMTKAILLPFQGKIIYDGVLLSAPVSFGPGIRGAMNASYQAAKDRQGIVTSLPIETEPAPMIEESQPAKTPTTRTTKKTTRAANKAEVSAETEGSVYQLRITLLETEPAIWRRIQVENCTLDKLHEHIQTAMGWTNSHLHQFWFDGQRFGDPQLLREDFADVGDDDFVDSTQTMLSEILAKKRKKFAFGYEYDFGDGWQHEIVFEGMVPAEKGVKYPRCIEGERACPPEDCGGTPGFENFLEAMADRKHPDHRDLKEWYGGKFDAEKFDPARATREMKKGVFDWRGT